MLYESPSGNQVDGLPLVAHTGAGLIGRPFTAMIASIFGCFVGFVLVMLLLVFNQPLSDHRYMVRSTLLQVTRGRQNAQDPILHYALPDPL